MYLQGSRLSRNFNIILFMILENFILENRKIILNLTIWKKQKLIYIKIYKIYIKWCVFSHRISQLFIKL